MDQYVSWSLSTDELTLDIIWEKFEEFCKPQLNEVRTRFGLLTNFWQGNKSVDEWYNAVQIQVALAKYHQEIAKILHRDIFWFFLKDEEFVSKTINDPQLKKLAPSDLEIGTYTTNTVKIAGSCLFYLVHPDTQKLQEVTFYVAKNDGSVLLSCTTALALGLIQPHTRLDYLPPRASFITSSLDHPRKTKKSQYTDQRKKCLLKILSKQLQCLMQNNLFPS